MKKIRGNTKHLLMKAHLMKKNRGNTKLQMSLAVMEALRRPNIQSAPKRMAPLGTTTRVQAVGLQALILPLGGPSGAVGCQTGAVIMAIMLSGPVHMRRTLQMEMKAAGSC